MNPRLVRFHSLKSHLVIGVCFKVLGPKEIQACEAFINESTALDDNEFAHKINRWMLDWPKEKRPSSKKVSAMWALVSQSIEPKVRK